jgi:hypothetical protein
MFPDSAFAWLFIVCGCLVFLNMLQGYRLSRYLRAHHPDISDRLDETELGEGPDVTKIVAFMRFVFQKEYLRLKDPMLNRLCRTSQVIYSASFGSIIFLILFFLANWNRSP